jgi:hypothetical protein
MKILVYILEAITAFFLIWIFHYFLIKGLRKKFNEITSIIFCFVVLGLMSFLLAPYVMRFPNPEFFYFTYLIFWLIYDIVKLNKSSNK